MPRAARSGPVVGSGAAMRDRPFAVRGAESARGKQQSLYPPRRGRGTRDADRGRSRPEGDVAEHVALVDAHGRRYLGEDVGCGFDGFEQVDDLLRDPDVVDSEVLEKRVGEIVI